MEKIRLYIIFSLLFAAVSLLAQTSQRTAMSGVVVDAESGETLPFVQVYFAKSVSSKGVVPSGFGTTTDLDGNFSVSNNVGYSTITFQMVG
jgi:hypothetical protein